MLETLLENAGDDGSQPLPPENGIQRQWLPNFIRFPIQLMVLPFVLLDYFGQWIAKQIIRPPFKKVGKCKKRGNCCHYILIRKIRFPFSLFDQFWHTQVNGFYKRDDKVYIHNKNKVHLMGCRHLKKDGSCGRYFLRPMICRTWPRIEYFGYPQILKGCGFQAKPKTSSGKNLFRILK